MIASRLRGFGQSIFTEITQLANEHGAINLGQGFPDEDGPKSMLDMACHEIRTGNNQYAPAKGYPELREAVAENRSSRGHKIAPHDVLITVGGTEAISSSLLGLIEPDSEVNCPRTLLRRLRCCYRSCRRSTCSGSFDLHQERLATRCFTDREGDHSEDEDDHH